MGEEGSGNNAVVVGEHDPIDAMPLRTSAWQCCGSSNDALVANLRAAGAFANPAVAATMRAVDRRHYVRFEDFAMSMAS